MKLIIFSPAIRTSAIGRMTNLVFRSLVSQGHEVAIVRTESEHLLETPTHDFGTELIKWNDVDQVKHVTNEADALVYQIGNNIEFHQGGIEWLSKLSGLVCLHDFYLGHLFYGWAQTRRQEADTVLRNWYGDEIANRFFCHSSQKFIEGTRESSPMTEWICSMAYGVITHSSWGIERVLKSCAGPVQVVPLAYDAPATLIDAPQLSRSENNQFKLLTIGHINTNKRVASVIRAIGNSPLLRRCTVCRLVGHILPETVLALSALARQCQVNLLISGEADDATLREALQDADVISCLRWPILEAASASAIEAMLYGKPIIVTDIAFYAEIPCDCVVKIAPNHEIDGIKAALEFFAANPIQRTEIGMRAKKWASKQFSLENYALRLVACVTDVHKAEPHIRALNHFSNLMRHWSGAIDILPAEIIASLKLFEGSSR